MEGVTFQDPLVHKALDTRFIESRLHMDAPERIPQELWPVHRILQRELIGSRAVPYYAIIDPKTDELFFVEHLRGGEPGGWRDDFLTMFDMLPEKPKKG